MRNIFLILLPLFFIGCAQKVPVTWEKRVLHSKVAPVDLVYQEYGKEHNETILFLHGFGESKYTWRFLIDDLSKKYHLVILDLKGFGESPKTEDGGYSVYDQAKQVQKFIEHHKLKNLTVVGRSFGGGVSLVLALMQEEGILKDRLEKMVLINTMSYNQRLPSMMRDLQMPVIGFLGIHMFSSAWIAKEAYKFAFSNDELIPDESVNYAAKMMALPRAKYAYLETVNCIIPDDIAKMEKRYKDITLPTLILWGRDDVSIKLKMAHRLHRDLPYSKLRVFPNVGHMPQEEVPKKVIEEILKFMEEN
ncbi:MAG: alpha/beta hydrolase [Epsilonproteobacteria bacterium]|nr:alpha/beta hydrolase [Campylobacterota bacterium]